MFNFFVAVLQLTELIPLRAFLRCYFIATLSIGHYDEQIPITFTLTFKKLIGSIHKFSKKKIMIIS